MLVEHIRTIVHLEWDEKFKEWKGNCPFHDDIYQALRIINDDFYHCFACCAHGKTIEQFERTRKWANIG